MNTLECCITIFEKGLRFGVKAGCLDMLNNMQMC